ncbi:MAG: hypothetical protein M1828_002456 [Chrysothrix sp. TS-e1954]|nr:MAG: hypothetical protein M1828_002456 [Chrysothrix sp. TS-e1954]
MAGPVSPDPAFDATESNELFSFFADNTMFSEIMHDTALMESGDLVGVNASSVGCLQDDSLPSGCTRPTSKYHGQGQGQDRDRDPVTGDYAMTETAESVPQHEASIVLDPYGCSQASIVTAPPSNTALHPFGGEGLIRPCQEPRATLEGNKTQYEHSERSPSTETVVSESYSPSTKTRDRWRMQQVSELSVRIFAQLSAYDTGCEAQRDTETLENLMRNVLTISGAFQRLLASFYPSSSISSSQTGRDVHGPHRYSNHYASSQDTAGCDGDHASAHDFPKTPVTHTNGRLSESCLSLDFDPNLIDPVERPIPHDTAMCLQLLSCHMRLLKLHHILYTMVLERLCAINRGTYHGKLSGNDLASLSPAMHINGLNLTSLGIRFRWRISIQMALHSLGRIEAMLGLLDGLRLVSSIVGTAGPNGRPDGPSHGILESSMSAWHVQTAIKEAASSGVSKDNDVGGIRSTLEDLRRELRGTMDF